MPNRRSAGNFSVNRTSKMLIGIWRLSPGSSSRALEEGVVIQVFKNLEKGLEDRSRP